MVIPKKTGFQELLTDKVTEYEFPLIREKDIQMRSALKVQLSPILPHLVINGFSGDDLDVTGLYDHLLDVDDQEFTMI